MPVFEGLFPPEHDREIQTLLFRLAQWHALAKLRLHMDHSLDLLDKAIRLLRDQLCRFQQFTCTAFKTMELPSETAARRRQQERNLDMSTTCGARPKSFNLVTYKFHALGNYVCNIRLFGMTDSYTTHLVSSLHICDYHPSTQMIMT